MLSALGVTDLAGVLLPPDEKRLLRAIDEFHLRFPQSKVAILINHFHSIALVKR